MKQYNLSGTLIKNYYHCKRQSWLYSRGINFRNETTKIGNLIHNEKNTKEYIIENIKVDDIDFKKMELIEYKKSSANLQGSIMQVLFYLDILQKKGLNFKGKIKDVDFNEEHEVKYDKEKIQELREEIEQFLQNQKPPEPVKIKGCNNCSFYDYCWTK